MFEIFVELFRSNKSLTFFLVDQIDFPISYKVLKILCFGQIFLRCRQKFKKQAKKSVFRHFLEKFDKKNVFFSARAPPSKLLCIGAKGAFQKILGSNTINGYLKKWFKGGTLWIGKGSNP